MSISVIVPVFNKIEIIEECLRLNVLHADQACEWIIIDNASDEPTKEGLKRIEKFAKNSGHEFKIITETYNTGVAVAWNKGLESATGNYICVLNNDCVMMPRWCTALSNQSFDIYTPFVLEPWMFRQKYDLADFISGNRNYRVYQEKNRNRIRAGIFGGVILFARKEIFDKVGTFDENFWLSLEEMDYLFRAQKMGLRIGTIGNVIAFHYGGATRNTMKTDGGKANQEIFAQKWGWNFEKQENRWFNILIRKVQRRTWEWFGLLSTLKMIFPKTL